MSTLTITVTDKYTGEAVAGLRIDVSNGNSYTLITDSDGIASETVVDGSYNLETDITDKRYNKYQAAVEVSGDTNVSVELNKRIASGGTY